MKSIKSLLICKKCNLNLRTYKNKIVCSKCKSTFKRKNNKFYFLKGNAVISDEYDFLKSLIKRNAKIYQTIVYIISPVLFRKKTSAYDFIQKWCQTENQIGLNLGSGNKIISKYVTNIDIFDYDNVDLIAEIDDLPIQANSVDFVMSTAVLEHVPNPQKVVDEAHRVLKRGGYIYSYIPFIQGYHASPHDYSRFTINGIKQLHKRFHIIEVGTASGPTSGLSWILGEWLALFFSIGNEKLFSLLSVIFMILLSPLKLIDLILVHHPKSHVIASGMYLIGKKK